MFYIDREKELTKELLTKIINNFVTNKRPRLQLWRDYYEGKHAIMGKSYADQTKPCNRIVTNFCKIIADGYDGYICGKPISYTSNEDITAVQDVINYNDAAAADSAFLKNGLVYGVAYELQWIDSAARNRFAQINPLNSFPIFDNSLDSELLYFVRWYDADNLDDSNEIIIEVYSAASKKVYKSSGLCGLLEFVTEEAHYFKDVPVSTFRLNEDEENIFNCIIGLNDAYNELQSAEIDDFQEWVDAYLVFTGADGIAGEDDEDAGAAMRKGRMIFLPENAKGQWLTKSANDTQIVNMLDNIKQNIFKVSSCPDMADDTFLAQSGTALAYKLVGFENVASGIVAEFKKSIQRRIELICNVLEVKAEEAAWRDIGINFVRNLPVNLTEIIQLVNALKGTVSSATLLSQIPFIDDVQKELEAVQREKESNIALYNFGGPDDDKEDDEA